jgi:hypothetical protein
MRGTSLDGPSRNLLKNPGSDISVAAAYQGLSGFASETTTSSLWVDSSHGAFCKTVGCRAHPALVKPSGERFMLYVLYHRSYWKHSISMFMLSIYHVAQDTVSSARKNNVFVKRETIKKKICSYTANLAPKVFSRMMLSH